MCLSEPGNANSDGISLRSLAVTPRVKFLSGRRVGISLECGRGVIDPRATPVQSAQSISLQPSGEQRQTSVTAVVREQMIAAVTPAWGPPSDHPEDVAGSVMHVRGDALPQLTSCTCSIGPSLVASLRRNYREQLQDGGCLAESFRPNEED
jgi:hypothetical protein